MAPRAKGATAGQVYGAAVTVWLGEDTASLSLLAF